MIEHLQNFKKFQPLLQELVARDIKIRGYKEAFESGTLEQDNVEEAISLGVLTKEQAIEIGLVSKDAEDAFASEEVTTDTYSVDTNKE